MPKCYRKRGETDIIQGTLTENEYIENLRQGKIDDTSQYDEIECPSFKNYYRSNKIFLYLFIFVLLMIIIMIILISTI